MRLRLLFTTLLMRSFTYILVWRKDVFQLQSIFFNRRKNFLELLIVFYLMSKLWPSEQKGIDDERTKWRGGLFYNNRSFKERVQNAKLRKSYFVFAANSIPITFYFFNHTFLRENVGIFLKTFLRGYVVTGIKICGLKGRWNRYTAISFGQYARSK